LIPYLKEQNAGTLKRLREFADKKFDDQAARERPENGDFKIDMTKDDLKQVVGEAAFRELELTFADTYDEIILRRCSSHGKFINFHTDVSLKTMQLAVNGEEEYVGGRLVYVTKDGL
jgi:hypothetical protein